MTELVADPDVEDLLATYLTAQHQARGRIAPASTRLPDTREGAPMPAEFTVVRRVGGSRPTVVSVLPTVVVESYAPLESDALSLAALDGALLRSLPAGDVRLGGLPVYEVGEVAGIANLPDPRVPGRVRYTQTLTVHIRGQVLTS